VANTGVLLSDLVQCGDKVDNGEQAVVKTRYMYGPRSSEVGKETVVKISCSDTHEKLSHRTLSKQPKADKTRKGTVQMMTCCKE